MKLSNVMLPFVSVIRVNVNSAFCPVAYPSRLPSSVPFQHRVVRIIHGLQPHHLAVRPTVRPTVKWDVRHGLPLLIPRHYRRPIPLEFPSSPFRNVPFSCSLSSISATPPSTPLRPQSEINPTQPQARDAIDKLREQYQDIPNDAKHRHSSMKQLIRKLFPFKLDDFQLDSLNALCSDSSVVLSAPTGAGKTVIGEMAVFLALCRQQRVFYTTPLKALSNQKFSDFKRLFGVNRVGLLTGDITINRDADILVMTTEIYRNMLYADATERNVGVSPTEGLFAVVLDEFHYLNDRDRGTVWEESVINSPSHVLLVALSATMSNARDVRDWFFNVQGKTQLVQSDMRPVPLKFGYCDQDGLTPLFAEEEKRGDRRKGKGFGRRGTKGKTSGDAEVKMHPKLLRRIKSQNTSSDSRSSPGDDSNSSDDKRAMRDGYERIVKRNNRRSSFLGIPSFPYVVRVLRRREMLPCIFFIFSRAGCDRAATSAASERENLLSPREERIVNERLNAFVSENPDMVQQDRIDLAMKGIASHHAGLLPLWKLCVEELFQDGLIKVVFATETLAAGINMPARTTVISALSKRAGDEGFRALTTSEVLQMAGRAGRRGKDTVGHSLILRSRKEGALEAFKVLTKSVDALDSKFSPTYGMVLNLLLTRPLEEAKRLLDRSFGNFLRQRGMDHTDRDLQNADSSDTDVESLWREKAALQAVLQDAGDILAKVDKDAVQSFVKCLERVKAEKRALAYLIQQSEEINSNAIEDVLTFAPTGTKLLLREKVKPSTGAERRQKRRDYKGAILAAGAGDGTELHSFYLSGENTDLEDVEHKEEVSECTIEAVLLDLHPESVNVLPIFAAIDAHGQLRLFNHTAVTQILYDDEAVDVETIASGWGDLGLPGRSNWRSIGVDQFVAPLPDCLNGVVTEVRKWKAERTDSTGENVAIEAKEESKTPPEIEKQLLRVEDAKRVAREQPIYQREDLPEILAAKQAISKIEATLDGSSDPFAGKRKRRRSRTVTGRYANLSGDEANKNPGAEAEGDEIVDNSSWEEFMSLVGVLQQYGFIDDDYNVTSIGEMGAKVRSENELWTAVVLMEPDLESVSPLHLGAIIGATQMEGGARGDAFVDWELSEEVRNQISQLLPVRTRMVAVQNEFQAEVGIGLDGELMGLVEMWSSGVPWVELLRATSLQEGDVCRIVRRTLDVLRQIQHLPVVSAHLKKNARRAIALLDRFPITDDRTYWVGSNERAQMSEMADLNV